MYVEGIQMRKEVYEEERKIEDGSKLGGCAPCPLSITRPNPQRALSWDLIYLFGSSGDHPSSVLAQVQLINMKLMFFRQIALFHAFTVLKAKQYVKTVNIL